MKKNLLLFALLLVTITMHARQYVVVQNSVSVDVPNGYFSKNAPKWGARFFSDKQLPADCTYDELMNDVLKMDSFSLLGKKRSPWWNVTKNYREYAYEMNKDTLWIYAQRLLTNNGEGYFVCWLSLQNGATKQDLESIVKSVQTKGVYELKKWFNILEHSYWYWLVIAVFFTLYGAATHNSTDGFATHLSFAVCATVVISPLIIVPLWGEWILMGGVAFVAFLLALLAHGLGIYVAIDTD